jgi:hypothetical protein
MSAYPFRYPIAIDTPRTPDAARQSFDFRVVCVWAVAGLTLTAMAFSLGLVGQAGELLELL